jgi:hypothetical protein
MLPDSSSQVTVKSRYFHKAPDRPARGMHEFDYSSAER